MQTPYSDQPRYRDDPSAKDEMTVNEKASLAAQYNLGTLEDAVTPPVNKRRCNFIRGCRSFFGEASQSICTRVSMVLLKVVLFIALLGFFVKSTFFGFKPQCTHSKSSGGFSVNNWHDHGPSEERDISINTTTTSIEGAFPLYDSLNLTTVTGSIAVVIDPQPANPEKPDKPARVSIRTESGSISVSFRLPGTHPALSDAKKIQSLYHSEEPSALSLSNTKNAKYSNMHAFLTPRAYEVEIHTASGSVSGQVAFSNLVNISTISGSVSANLIPLVFLPAEDEEPPRDPDDDPYHPPHDGRDDLVPARPANISIVTSTVTGTVQVSLDEPFFPPPPEEERKKANNKPGRPKNLPHTIAAHHVAHGAGSLHVVYPPSWAGRVHAATTGKGQVSIEGDGLIVRGGNKTVADGVRYPDFEDDGEAAWWGASGKMNVTVASDGGMVDFFARG